LCDEKEQFNSLFLDVYQLTIQSSSSSSFLVQLPTTLLQLKKRKYIMGNKTSKANKEFQAVIPYTPSSRPNPKRKKAPTQPRRPTVAPALLAKENSGVSIDSDDQNANNPRRIPLRSPSISADVGWAPESSNFDFTNTEGQNRRELIASCMTECSMITSFLYVGGFEVANSREILNKNKITRIINCSLCAVDNVFESDDAFTYLSLNMLDGRQDDVSWFVCEVINFIEIARRDKCKVLLHCEKGISRSCSFAISYIMWAAGTVAPLIVPGLYNLLHF
jgi:hypothetical protein